jgi:hypothetical protein
MQLNSKTKNIAEKVQKVRNETIREKKSPQGAKNIAQIIQQSGDSNRFVEEVTYFSGALNISTFYLLI